MAKDAEIRDLQKAAQEFYESKKYGEALESYNKAVVLAQKWSPSDVPAILDQRVAVHVKLGNIDMARQDAMGMIRNNKADGRGYLRCGQLDRLGGDLAAALRWYEHGLKHVSSNDPLRSALNAQRNKTKGLLEQKLMASNARDPVSTLPAELIQHIATYLDYIELVKVLRVSKAWKETLSSLKPLTDSVDFSDGRCEITYKMMAAVLKRLGKNPKRLIMKNLAYSAEELLRTDLLRWQRYTQLEELTARQMIHGGTNIPYAKYNLKYLSLTMPEKGPEFGTISDILNECKALEVVCFTNVNRNHLPSPEGQGITVESARPNMRVFQLFCSNREGSPHRRLNATFLAAFPHLEEIAFHRVRILSSVETWDLSGFSSLRKLSLSSCTMSRWPKLPPSIEVWDNLRVTILEPLVIDEDMKKFRLGTLARLKVLRFNETSPPPPMYSFMPIKSTGSLISLDVRNTPIMTLFDTTVAYSFELDRKNLQNLACGNNEGWLIPLTGSEKLETVSLIAHPLYGVEIIDLLKRPENSLRQITLLDCENVSPDTIEWARNQGVTMHVKKSQPAAGTARRVRGQ